MKWKAVSVFLGILGLCGAAGAVDHETIIRIDAEDKNVLVRSVDGESPIVVEAISRTRVQAFEFVEYLQNRDRFESVVYQKGADEELGHGFTLIVQPVPPDDGVDRSRYAYRAVSDLIERQNPGRDLWIPGWGNALINRYKNGNYRVSCWLKVDGERRRYTARARWRDGSWTVTKFEWIN